MGDIQRSRPGWPLAPLSSASASRVIPGSSATKSTGGLGQRRGSGGVDVLVQVMDVALVIPVDFVGRTRRSRRGDTARCRPQPAGSTSSRHREYPSADVLRRAGTDWARPTQPDELFFCSDPHLTRPDLRRARRSLRACWMLHPSPVRLLVLEGDGWRLISHPLIFRVEVHLLQEGQYHPMARKLENRARFAGGEAARDTSWSPPTRRDGGESSRISTTIF